MRFRPLAVRGDRPVLRTVLLMGVFAATAVAFWWHFERRMQNLAPPDGGFLRDAGKVLSVEESRALSLWRSSFKDSLGIPVLILVTPETLVVPDFSPGTLFVGAGLRRPEAVIALPPLARRALGEGPRLAAEESLALCLGKEAPAPCLQKTLRALWQDLGGQ